MGDTQPPLQYLFACSQDAVESYTLSRQNQLANIHRAFTDLFDVWLRARRDERAGRCILELRRSRPSPIPRVPNFLLEALGSVAFPGRAVLPHAVCLLSASAEKLDQPTANHFAGRAQDASLSEQQRLCRIIGTDDRPFSARLSLCESTALWVSFLGRYSCSMEPIFFRRVASSTAAVTPWRGKLLETVGLNTRGSRNAWKDLRAVRRSAHPAREKFAARSSLTRNGNRVLEIQGADTPQKPGPIRMPRQNRQVAAS
jgi:hypothetical protein